MILDTSAVVAFLRSEPESDAIEDALMNAEEVHISALTVFEARVVLAARFGAAAASEFDLLLIQLGATVQPFDSEQAERAYLAYRRYGKGTGHRAQLNLGDCAAYALATTLGLPLLYKGNDFTHSDVASAL